MKRFYTDLIISNTAYLQDVEAGHCTKVLRCRVGDSIECMDGNGLLLKGTISEIKKHEVAVEIIETIEHQSSNINKLAIALPPTKNPARFEWFVEKATEIGIAHIYPMLTERTEKASLKMERLNHIVISAAKQSRQLFYPKIHELKKMEDIMDINEAQQKLIAHCVGQKESLLNLYKKNEDALLLIGPEGDFTNKEIEQAINKNYQPVSLGNSILRVETAGIAATVIVTAINAN